MFKNLVFKMKSRFGGRKEEKRNKKSGKRNLSLNRKQRRDFIKRHKNKVGKIKV